MKEIQSILHLLHSLEKGTQAALATVVHIEDSSYRRPGARMLILENGTFRGGISGGCLEGDALRKAQKVIYTKNPILTTYDTRDPDNREIGVGLGCEGRIQVFIQPITDPQQWIQLFQQMLRIRQPEYFATAFQSSRANDPLLGSSFFLREYAQLQASLNKALDTGPKPGQAATVNLEWEGAEVRFFVEHMQPNVHLVVCGDHRDAVSLLQQAGLLGMQLTLFGNAVKHSAGLQKEDATLTVATDLQQIEPDRWTAIVSMHHDYDRDKAALAHFSNSGVGYFGLLGPGKRFDKMAKELELSPSIKESIHSPIGLPIGAESPEEISTAILAEIINYYREGTAQSLKDRPGPIHDRGL